MRRRTALVAVTLVILTWSAALIAAPSASAPGFSAAIYAVGSMVCHQRPERSFHRDEAQYPVCARCLGLYVGAVVGAVGWLIVAGLDGSPRRRAADLASSGLRRALIVTAGPTLITVATAMIGWWDPNNTVRAALALPLGASIAAVVTAVAAGDMR